MMSEDVVDLVSGETVVGHIATPTYAYASFARREYYDCDKWKTDGERFLTQEFISEYIKTGNIPVLGDSRPEFIEWLYGTLATSVFYSEWGVETRQYFAKPFILSMLEHYSPHAEQLKHCLPYIKALICTLNVPELGV
jgi:hypothetical protein